jgi:hypothetical protein
MKVNIGEDEGAIDNLTYENICNLVLPRKE